MRVISSKQITYIVSKLCQKVNYSLGSDVTTALKNFSAFEESEIGKQIFEKLEENAEIAENECIPLCQDTGAAVIFVEYGQEVLLEGDSLTEAVNSGVVKGYSEGYLRKSMVKDPFNRENTGDNTPAIIHTEITTGDKIKLTVAAKGGGSENMSAMKMLPPSAGYEGVVDFIVETIDQAGPNPCPPLVIGVGIGGNFELAPFLAKKALMRSLDDTPRDKFYADMEQEILEKVNLLGIGPQGYGGTVTAFGVKIETSPCHIASLPVAVNIDCHCHRHASETI